VARKNAGKVMTVMGLIEPEELGHTITHEHLYFDLTGYRASDPTPDEAVFYYEQLTLRNLNRIRKDAYGNRDNCVHLDRAVALREIAAFQEKGGRTIVDVTPGGVREGIMDIYAPMVKDLAFSSGLNVVLGFGHYVMCAHDTKESPITLGKRMEGMEKMTAEQIAEMYIEAIDNGFGDTGIRPGIIGELGTGSEIHPEEEKVLRAGAIAQQHSGLAITLHMHLPVRRQHETLDILKSEGAIMDKIVLGHSDGVLTNGKDIQDGIDFYLSLLERGAYIELDLIGNGEYFKTDEASWWLPSDRERAAAIAAMCKAGYSSQILISQDTGHKYYLLEYGGWGYVHALDGFRRTLLEADLDEATIDKLTIDNPRRMLTIV